MSDDDDALEEHERLNESVPTYWGGQAHGGPLDGCTVKIDAVPWLELRALHLTVGVGPMAPSTGTTT
jgi:hypothetical protein